MTDGSLSAPPSAGATAPQRRARPRDELTVFLIICVVLFPALTIAVMGLYGLIVWISHMLGG